MKRIRQVRKRDGRLVPFDRSKIADAIFRAARSVGGEDRFLAEELAGVVVMHLERRVPRLPSIEDVQDVVEQVLIETGHARTAKAYILYRERRNAARAARQAAEAGAHLLVGGDGARRRWPGPRPSWSRPWSRPISSSGPRPRRSRGPSRSGSSRSGLPRVSGRLVRALVQAELFDRGRESRLGEEARVALGREEIATWLARGPAGRRADDPEAFSQALGERALSQYVLAEVFAAGGRRGTSPRRPACVRSRRAARPHVARPAPLGAPRSAPGGEP